MLLIITSTGDELFWGGRVFIPMILNHLKPLK